MDNTFWRSTLSGSAGVVIAALVIGFFGLIYEKANKYDEVVKRLEILEKEHKNSENKFVQEIAEISVKQDVIEENNKVIIQQTITEPKPPNGDKPTPTKPEVDKPKSNLQRFLDKQEQLQLKLRPIK